MKPLGRRTWIVVTIAAVVVVLLGGAGGLTGWLLTAKHSAEQVVVRWRPHCTGTTLSRYRGHLAVRSVPGWRCRLTMKVRNRSGYDIHVTGVKGPFMGTGGGAEVQGFSTQNAPIRDDPDSMGIDAIWDVDLTVPGHASRTIDLLVGWRNTGCNDAGHEWFDHWPTIVFTILHRDHQVSASERLTLATVTDHHDTTGACAG
ncbi:hypothetical protein [Nocardioides sp. KR10-350]|uniref:hypothetical protein n=1 Tax=Nocardioides cheoyonin TaxID=3156615 RepID=UPI0032B3437C